MTTQAEANTPKHTPGSSNWEEIANDQTMKEGVRRYYQEMIDGEKRTLERRVAAVNKLGSR